MCVRPRVCLPSLTLSFKIKLFLIQELGVFPEPSSRLQIVYRVKWRVTITTCQREMKVSHSERAHMHKNTHTHKHKVGEDPPSPSRDEETSLGLKVISNRKANEAVSV